MISIPVMVAMNVTESSAHVSMYLVLLTESLVHAENVVKSMR